MPGAASRRRLGPPEGGPGAARQDVVHGHGHLLAGRPDRLHP